MLALQRTREGREMKLYKAHWVSQMHGGRMGCQTYWHHTKKAATDEARSFDAIPTHWTVSKFYTRDHAENMKRLLNGDDQLIGESEIIKNPKAGGE